MFEEETRRVMTPSMNRLHNMTNSFQGSYKKVLCVCSAGLLRSPTAAWVLAQDPYNFNTRAVGINSEYALIGLDSIQLSWADEIVVMEVWMGQEIEKLLKEKVLGGKNKPIFCLNVPDAFPYRDPELIKHITNAYNKVSGFPSNVKPVSLMENLEE